MLLNTKEDGLGRSGPQLIVWTCLDHFGLLLILAFVAVFQSLSIQQPFHGFRHQVLVIHVGWDHVAKWCNRTDLCLTKDVAADAGKPIPYEKPWSLSTKIVAAWRYLPCYMDVQSFTTSGWQVVYYQVFLGVSIVPTAAEGFKHQLELLELQVNPVDVSWCFLHGPPSFYFCSMMCVVYTCFVSLWWFRLFACMAITCHALSDKIGSTLSPEWGFCNGAQLQPQKCDLQACKHAQLCYTQHYAIKSHMILQ